MLGGNRHPNCSDKPLPLNGERFTVFQETFEVAMDGFLDVALGVLKGLSLAIAARQRGAERIVAPRFIGLDDDREMLERPDPEIFHRRTLLYHVRRTASNR